MPISRAAVEYVEQTGGVHFAIPAHPGKIGLARLLVHTLAQRRDLDDERVEDLVLAVSEACTAAVDADDPDVPVVLRWREDRDRCVVEVMHQGRGGRIPDTDRALSDGPPTDPGRAAVEGELRLPLIRALVDEVAVASPDEGGTHITMTLKCGPWTELEGL